MASRYNTIRDGSMARLLDDSNVPWNNAVDRDPYSFLPGWLQSR